jgi:hypothetical protein
MANPEEDDFAAATAQAVQRAQAEERTRFGTIMGSSFAKVHGALAALLVSDGVAADKAVGYLKAASDDTDAALKAAKPEEEAEATEEEKDKAAKAFADKKAKAGSLGLGTPDSTERPAGAAATGWGKAVASANRGVI